MRLLRAIILIIVLVAQALPVPAVALGEVQPKCGMTCCAAQKMFCCCAEPAQAPVQPAPASTPPVTGRELVPVTLWLAFMSFPQLETSTEVASAWVRDRSADTRPHVRLPVMYCAILI